MGFQTMTHFNDRFKITFVSLGSPFCVRLLFHKLFFKPSNHTDSIVFCLERRILLFLLERLMGFLKLIFAAKALNDLSFLQSPTNFSENRIYQKDACHGN